MSTLILLLASFGSVWLLDRFVLRNQLPLSFMGRFAIAVMLLFTGWAHFFKQQEMIEMMPDFFPYKLQLVYITGVMEIAGAIGLLTRRFAIAASFCLMFFFFAVLPANIIGAQKRVALGGMESGPVYLYFRIPLQLLFVAWTYYFGVHLARMGPEQRVAGR